MSICTLIHIPKRLLFTLTSPPPPRLRIYKRFLEQEQRVSVQKKVLHLHEAILNSPITSNASLLDDARYNRVMIDDEQNRKIIGHHLKMTKGHNFSYFYGNRNLPRFVTTQLFKQLFKIPEVASLSYSGNLNWNFRLESFAPIRNQASVPEIPFRSDAPNFGEMTMIYPLCQQSIFQIRPQGKPTIFKTYQLVSNSMVFLWGDLVSKNEYRIVPLNNLMMPPHLKDANDMLKGAHLVLGVTRLNRHFYY